MAYLIGTDPEVFVTDSLGKYFSAHDLIPGTKENPYPVLDGAIQVDGVALEFNTNPASTADEFIAKIKSVMDQMTEEYQKNAPHLKITITPTATFDQKYFDRLPDEPKLLGCTPDYNAYTGKQNTPPETTEPFRTGSGHIHVGFTDYSPLDDIHFEECRELVKQLDTILYMSSLLWDSDSKRRQLYGKIGAFRPKSYGVEYRPMSNAYLSSPIIQRFVFEASVHATSLLRDEGIKLYETDAAGEMVNMVLSGETPTKKELQDYLSWMHSEYKTPLFLGL